MFDTNDGGKYNHGRPISLVSTNLEQKAKQTALKRVGRSHGFVLNLRLLGMEFVTFDLVQSSLYLSAVSKKNKNKRVT